MTRKQEDHPAGGEEGRLIALDGTRAADLRRAAELLSRRLSSRHGDVGISWWDASGVFFEMALGKRKHRAASARTLLLLYASDLLFRVRWEIQPAIDAGRTVIAVPYLDAALAFGQANGLSRDWLVSLFRFAPAPSACYRAPEHKKSAGWKNGHREGFAEFASAILSEGTASFDPVAVRRQAIAFLDSSGRARKCPGLR